MPKLINKKELKKLGDFIDDVTNLLSILLFFCKEHNDEIDAFAIYSMVKCVYKVSSKLNCFFLDLTYNCEEIEFECCK